jgi:GMP synthase (glutamine-hydrolysing)
MQSQIIALRHVSFEDLDALAPLFAAHGAEIRYIDTPLQADFAAAALAADLLVVLGGPVGVYEQEDYPFLKQEIEVVRQRLAAGKAVLGICLGAQIIAAALGAQVYPGTGGKELGWEALQLSPAGMRSPLGALADGQAVLHWHGDTFDLPTGAVLLASSARYPHQAFSWGNAALALQFHIEVSALGLERWLVGHALEIASTPEVSVGQLRSAAAQHCPGLARVQADLIAALAG